MNLSGPAKHLNSQPLPHNHLCKNTTFQNGDHEALANEGTGWK